MATKSMSNKEDIVLEVDLEEGESTSEEAPVGVLSAEEAEKLITYLDEEFQIAESERSEKKEQWKKWRRQREFRPEKKSLDYPWPKSANVSVPMSGMLTQNMWAYIKNTFQVRDPLISVSSITKLPGDVELALTLEKYLDLLAESPFDLNLRPRIGVLTLEFTSMGTSFAKVPWTIDKWVFRKGEETVESTLHDGPEWVVIGREDLLYREYVQDLQKAPWVAHHFELSEHELYNRGQDGIYQNVEQALKDYRTQALDHQTDQQDRMGVVQQDAKIYDLYEVYVFWKLPGERYMVDLLVTYHQDSGQILRAEYNEIGLRPFGVLNYVERPFYLDGIGVGWITEHMQDEVDYHHRLRINNSHFASMMMWAVRRGAGFAGKESVYPGKIWKVDDPQRDIVPLQGGQIYPTSLQAEAMSLQYAERAVGFSDAQRGFADMVAKSGTSAQLQMFNAQQGGKLINSVIEGAVGSLSHLALLTVIQLVKNRERVIANETANRRLTPAEIRALDSALNIQMQDIPKKLKFSVRTTDMDKTFEVRRQNTLTMVQLYAMFWEKILPLLQMMESNQVPPTMKPVLMKAFTGSCNLMEKVFKFFGEDDTGKFIPDYKRMEVMQEIRAVLTNDLDQAKMLLEDLRSGRSGAGFTGAQAAAVGGAAGAYAAAEGGGGGPGNAGFPGMGGVQQSVPRPAGQPGPLA